MTPWSWYAGEVGEFTYDLACDEPSRNAAITTAVTQLEVGDQFQIIEARSSEAKKYEGDDITPFIRTRNHEYVTGTMELKRKVNNEPSLNR